ncbi:MAG: amidohydrolase family protein [Chloroflexi bacterium]|nr:amidohydrolase family protein [Chloroflexota bacterium]
MRVIDGDGHVFEDSKGMQSFLPEPFNQGEGLTRWFPPLDHFHGAMTGVHPPGSFQRVGPAGWIDFMDAVGIEQAVLYSTGGLAFGKIFHYDWAIAVARAYNNWLHETYLKTSPRFTGMAIIPMQEPEAAIAELRRAVEEMGFSGAMIPSTGLPNHLGAKEYWPVWAEADRLGCAIGIHGGAHSGMGFDHLNVYTPAGGMGHPVGLMINFAGIVFNGILDRYPNVRFGFMEGGVGWSLLALERFDREHDTHMQWNPRGELAPSADEKFSDYLRKHIEAGRVYVGCEGNEPALAEAVRELGEECFVYSSDFPHEVNNELVRAELDELWENEEMTTSAKEAILHGNAERFYGVKGLAAV